MKTISDIINNLETIRAEYGDIPVSVLNGDTDWLYLSNFRIEVCDAKPGFATFGGVGNFVELDPYRAHTCLSVSTVETLKLLDTVTSQKIVVIK